MTGAKKQPENAGPADLSVEETDRIAAADSFVGVHQITDPNGGVERAKRVPNGFTSAAFRYGRSEVSGTIWRASAGAGSGFSRTGPAVSP